MNENLTYIAVVLDESGSMAWTAEQTRAGFNEFIQGQRALPGTCRVTLTKFNSWVGMPVFVDRDVREVLPLDYSTYSPAGGTALLDAVGSTIDSLGTRLAMLPENERPSKVVVVIMTDGEENSSRQFKLEDIQTKIAQQTSVYSWEFVFLGAGLAAFAQGAAFGISAASTMLYTAQNTVDVFNMTSKNINSYRSGEVRSVGYSGRDRIAAVNPASGTNQP